MAYEASKKPVHSKQLGTSGFRNLSVVKRKMKIVVKSSPDESFYNSVHFGQIC